MILESKVIYMNHSRKRVLLAHTTKINANGWIIFRVFVFVCVLFRCKKLKRENITQCKKPERRAKSNKLKRKKERERGTTPRDTESKHSDPPFQRLLGGGGGDDGWGLDTGHVAALRARKRRSIGTVVIFWVIKCAKGFAFVLIFF